MNFSAKLNSSKAVGGALVAALCFGVWTGAFAANVSTSEAAMLYQKYCSVCHGDKGDANSRAAGSLNPRPRDFTLPETATELTRARMIQSVTDGRPGTAMVGHAKKLSPGQIEAVVDYIRTSFMKLPAAAVPAAAAPAVTASAGTPASGATAGESIYKKHCSVCHGDKGNTAMWAQSGLNPPPRNFTGAAAKADLTRERMIQSVTHGRPGTAMQPFATRLSRGEIEAVIDYIRAAFMGVGPTVVAVPAQTGSGREADKSHVPDPHRGPHVPDVAGAGVTAASGPGNGHIPVDMAAAMPNKLKGNAKRGQDFYMKNCFTCHGVKGDGNGPRAYFITPRPRNFTHEQARGIYNRPRLYDAVMNGKRGTPMPAWGKVLNEQQIADVAEFVFQAYIKGSLKLDIPDAPEASDKKKAGST